MKKIGFYLGLGLLFIFSCKKEEGNAPQNSNATLQAVTADVQQRWTFGKFVHTETVGTTTTIDTIAGVSGDYFLFSKNNFVYSFWDGIADTVTYAILDEGHISYGSDTFSIINLTKTHFVISNKVQTANANFTDEIFLRR